jgi:hypothetical protein
MANRETSSMVFQQGNKKDKKLVKINRFFTKENIHPYDQIN